LVVSILLLIFVKNKIMGIIKSLLLILLVGVVTVIVCAIGHLSMSFIAPTPFPMELYIVLPLMTMALSILAFIIVKIIIKYY